MADITYVCSPYIYEIPNFKIKYSPGIFRMVFENRIEFNANANQFAFWYTYLMRNFEHLGLWQSSEKFYNNGFIYEANKATNITIFAIYYVYNRK